MKRIVLRFEEIKKDTRSIGNTVTLRNNYNWEGGNYPSKIENCHRFEKKQSSNCSQYFMY